jgi:lysophospholipase L1-like esterase
MRWIVLAALVLAGCASEEWEKDRTEQYFSDDYQVIVDQWAAEPRTTGGVMMLGDSIIYFWPEYLLPAGAKKRGMPGDSTKGVLNRLWLVLEEAPDQMFLLIGTNNFEFGQIYEAPDDIDQILGKIATALPGTEVYLLSILPASDRERPNDVIERINANYEVVCGRYENCTYVDLFSRLYLPSLGGFPQSDDGVHPNEAGYEVMAETLEPYW